MSGPALRVTVMQAASLTLSILALLVSGSALGWTIYAWQRSGAKLKVQITTMATMGGMGYLTGGGPTFYVAFDVTNSGRTATSVGAVGFHLPEGNVLVIAESAVPQQGSMPKRLEPGESFLFACEPSEIVRNCREKGVRWQDLKPYANSGHGTFNGKWASVAVRHMEDVAGRASHD